MVERKLYDIDSAALHAVTGGSDDGFLYARGFVVAKGREFYYPVAADAQMAVPWAELEEMRYLCRSQVAPSRNSCPSPGPAECSGGPAAL